MEHNPPLDLQETPVTSKSQIQSEKVGIEVSPKSSQISAPVVIVDSEGGKNSGANPDQVVTGSVEPGGSESKPDQVITRSGRVS